jgi:ABC-type lipoprotein release transport system permease subunit
MLLVQAYNVVSTVHALSVTPPLVTSVFVVTLLVGLFVAFYPARRAAPINPIDALRHN